MSSTARLVAHVRANLLSSGSSCLGSAAAACTRPMSTASSPVASPAASPVASAAAAAVAGASARSSSRPSNVGIVGMEVYFPASYVKQERLEEFDKAGKGKYTIGLGQKAMAFVDDREDINSMALTVVSSLLSKYKVDPRDVGRLEVGTETIIDKSKACKTTLMNLFAQSGNMQIEGLDTTNACYGGTNALFNAINWVESSSWDGRYAVVVAGDIAVYEPGVARPTGGAGIVAMLIGADAPLVVEPGVRATYMEDAYDFYKPNLESEYPVVDGKLSVTCYLRALDSCYNNYKRAFARANPTAAKPFTLDDAAFVAFHSPYTKLVMRSYARLLWNDALVAGADGVAQRYKELTPFVGKLSTEQSYTDKDLTKVLDTISAQGYQSKVSPSQLLSQELGNTYCGSLYCNLVSLLSNKSDAELVNKRLLLFSYGSGLAASMFSIVPRASVANIAAAANIKQRLALRTEATPQQFTDALALRERTHAAADYTPVGSGGPVFAGTYLLKNIDKLKRRTYVQA